MTTTLGEMPRKRKPIPWLRRSQGAAPPAEERRLSLTGPDRLLKQFTENVLKTALAKEMSEHLGHEKNGADQGRESTDVRRTRLDTPPVPRRSRKASSSPV